MSFFSKIARMINGTPSQPEVRTLKGGDDKRHATDTGGSNDFVDVPKEQRIMATLDTSVQTVHESQAAENIKAEVSYGDLGLRNSDSISEQRYGWHLFLLKIIASIEEVNPDNLKYFTIYIQKSNSGYQWNDGAFNAELRQALNKKNLAHVGSSSIVIEVVSEKTFKQLAEKTVTESQYKKQIENVILFGSKKETAEQKFATAIDKRAFVINELLKKFRSSTGTDAMLMENLVIVVIRNEEDDDMAKYDWMGKRFEDDLKRELANAFLEKIGSKSLQIVLKPKSETADCISLIDNQVYYKWGKTEMSQDNTPKEIPYERIIATLSIIEGTGSMMKPAYRLDSDSKKTYHIGRGVTSRKDGKYRVNDIVINDKEADQELLKCNEHVSSAHADIIFKHNKYYLKAAIGGCRASGGSPTKLVRDEKATELRDTSLCYPLNDGDIIELGKNVLLIFSISDDYPVQMTTDKNNRAMPCQ